MSTYAKAENIEIYIDREKYSKAVLHNTLTNEEREFTDITDVKIIDCLELDASFCNKSSEWETHLSVEEIGKQLHISKSCVKNTLEPLFKDGFLVDVSNLYELPD